MTDRLAAAVAELVAAIREEVGAEACPWPDPPRLLSVAEAAQALDLARSNAYRLIQSGQLRSIRVGGRRLVSLVALREFIAAAEGAAVLSTDRTVSLGGPVRGRECSLGQLHRRGGRTRRGRGSPG